MSGKFKESIKEERAKLAEMNFKEKVDYIWEYYKYHIIITVVSVLFIYMLIDALVLNPQKNVHVGVAIYGPYIFEETTNELTSYLTGNMQADWETSAVVITNFFVSEDDLQITNAMVQKFIAMLSVQEIDIFIGNELQFTQNARQGFFLDLSTAEGLNITPQEIKSFDFQESEDSPVVSFPCAIALNSDYFKTLTPNGEQLYLGIIVNSKRLPQTIEAVNLLLEKK
ncbi:MAG: hypothetical protein LBS21_00900 [Clostridiales bacterium]|jgi:hypothetical protein|nr:hypothetical protein [Clostridiales bacterium]